MRPWGLLAVAAVAFGACSDDSEPVTKADLQAWLEEGNSDGSQTDPRCVLDPLWEAGLSDADLRAMIEHQGPGAVPDSPAGLAYVRVRDECAYALQAEQCEAGTLTALECASSPLG